jgi:hypothetical protein
MAVDFVQTRSVQRPQRNPMRQLFCAARKDRNCTVIVEWVPLHGARTLRSGVRQCAPILTIVCMRNAQRASLESMCCKIQLRSFAYIFRLCKKHVADSVQFKLVFENPSIASVYDGTRASACYPHPETTSMVGGSSESDAILFWLQVE